MIPKISSATNTSMSVKPLIAARGEFRIRLFIAWSSS